MLTDDVDYHDLGGDYFARLDPERAMRRIVRQANALGSPSASTHPGRLNRSPAPPPNHLGSRSSPSFSDQVYGDSAYADGATLRRADRSGATTCAPRCPPVRNANGYSKDQFTIDLAAGTVTCPARHTVTISAAAPPLSPLWCAVWSCPLRAECTKARRGRVISIHLHEAALQQAKARQQDPAWQQDYRTYRPVVERKISHFTRRRWGGRNARCRGQKRIVPTS